MKLFGLVLAGGRSSRFGREKAAADVEGRPMIAWVVDRLARGCDVVAINAKPCSEAARFAAQQGLMRLTDDPSDPEGPLAGVRAGLAWARAAGADAVVTAPCDTPFLPQDMVERLAIAARAGGAVARTLQGLEPLCALWPASDLEAETLIAQAFDQGRHPPIREVLARLRAADVMFPDAAAFANLNTPADYAVALRSGRAKPE